MALIPLKQRVCVYKTTGRNEWGEMVFADPVTMRCRVDEGTQLVENQAGEEVVSTVSVMFDKYPKISYDDYLEYTDEHATIFKRKPIKIEPIRLINGKVTLTVVYL